MLRLPSWLLIALITIAVMLTAVCAFWWAIMVPKQRMLQIVAIAKRAALDSGVNLVEYNEPKAWRRKDKEHTWIVMFTAKEPARLHPFAVEVDDLTDRATFDMAAGN